MSTLGEIKATSSALDLKALNHFSDISFLTDDAAIWARPTLELLAEGKPVFDDDWDTFVEAFKAKFEVVNPVVEAKNKIANLKQGRRNFATLLAEFDMWAPRTGWSDKDLYDRLKSALNDKYLTRLLYFPERATTLDQLKKNCVKIDQALNNLHNNKTGTPSSSTTPTCAPTFRDPNAMDIDATRFDELFSGINDPEQVRRKHQTVMRNRCKVCGSDKHQTDFTLPAHGPDVTCRWCGKKKHWQTVCLNRLMGKPKAQNISATTDPSVAVA